MKRNVFKSSKNYCEIYIQQFCTENLRTIVMHIKCNTVVSWFIEISSKLSRIIHSMWLGLFLSYPC